MRERDKKIDEFLARRAFAVAGASTDREKYGNKVVRVYQQNNKTVYPINPRAREVEGEKAYASVGDIPAEDFALSLVTPPQVTLDVVRAALKRGVRYFWMQPGAENEQAVKEAEEQGATVIHGGACVLVALHYHE